MSKIFYRHLSQFRERFVSNVSEQAAEAWYPGHMYKGMKQMQAKLAVVDCFLEVHDARIPLCGMNPNFYRMLTAVRPRIFILNKSDLIDPSHKEKILECLRKKKIQNIMFTNCKTNTGKEVNKIIPAAVQLVKETMNHNRANALSINIMVIGIPNVGKSSLINRLRNIHLQRKKASAVGATPGITKSVLEKIKISDKPLVYLYDTPGVAQPFIDNIEVGLKLALCRILKDHLIGEELIADYLLYWLNKHKNFSYVEHFQLKEPVDDIRIVLFEIAKNFSLIQKIRNAEGSVVTVPDMVGSARHFINAFREGHFGKLLLDIDILNKVS